VSASPVNHTKPKLRVHCLSISLDGYAAGPNQSLDLPFGENTTGLHDWLFETRTARRSFGMEGGTTFHFVTDGINADLARAFEATDGHDVRVGGGPATIQQYLRAGLSTRCTSCSYRS
jgi:hypothetical protein